MREAIIHLRDEDLAAVGLDDAMAVLRDAGLKDVTELSEAGVIQVRVAEPIPDGELAGLDGVEWWETVDESTAGATYLWKLDVECAETGCPLDEHSTAYDVDAVRDRGLDLSVVGTHDAIGRTVDGFADIGLNVGLERLASYRGASTALDRLTRRQREVIRTAYALGYYDVPRQTSTAAVADELDLDPSTVSEHLQRAEGNLLGDVLVPAD